MDPLLYLPSVYVGNGLLLGHTLGQIREKMEQEFWPTTLWMSRAKPSAAESAGVLVFGSQGVCWRRVLWFQTHYKPLTTTQNAENAI